MATYTSNSSSTATSKPIGTLQSQDLYYQPPVPAQSGAAGMQGTDGRAYTRTVGQNELASTHLNNLLDGNGKYITNARQRGLEAAARRGMGNSSIAAGAAERAAIESASPFAMQSADAYGRAQTENLGFLNQNLMQERDIANQVLTEKYRADQMGQAGEAAREAARLQAENDYRMFQENLAYEGEQRGLDRAHDFGMSDMGYRQQRGLNEQNYGYDLGRQNNQNRWTSRENDRALQRDIARDNNRYSQEYSYDTLTAIRNQRIRYADAAVAFGLDTIQRDSSTALSDIEGATRFFNRLGADAIEDMLNGFDGMGG